MNQLLAMKRLNLVLVATAVIMASACSKHADRRATAVKGDTEKETPAIQSEIPVVVEWRAYTDLADGRRFLTDGILLLEARYAPSVTLPERRVEPEKAERLLGWKTTHEFFLKDLRRTAASGHYRAPKDILLNREYIDYLRGRPLSATLRFRASGPHDPVLILDGTKVVGAVMPMQE